MTGSRIAAKRSTKGLSRQTVGDVEAQTTATIIATRRKKRFECLPDVVGLHTRSVIAEGQLHMPGVSLH